ncbi:MAG: 4Fe-4S ferredoxin [Bacteroidales bacterium]|nr:4Fe-4S ferredoxin [Bacteroidales bacterium]
MGGGCPGSQTLSFNQPASLKMDSPETGSASALQQWPVQLHLVNPNAPYYRGADVVIAADCTAFSLGNFHGKYLKGKSLAIACPKLDSNLEVYVNKITTMVDQANINTLHVMIMEVPCCGGLLQIVKQGVGAAKRKVPVKYTVVGIQGEVVQEQWL